MHKRLLIFISSFFLLGSSVWAQQVVVVDKSWWKEKVTIEYVEQESRKWLAEQRKRYQNTRVTMLNCNDTIEPDEQTDHLDGDTECEKPGVDFISVINRLAVINNRDWNILKAKYREGDSIYFYAAPPVGGPIGYILVRDEKTVFNIVLAVQ